MINLDILREEAKYLNKYMRLDWSNYDFTEKATSPNRRVPKIEFLIDVKKVLDEVQHYPQKVNELYVREYQLEYKGNTYVFEVSVRLVNGVVKSYNLDVYTPAGDGRGGLCKLFSEKI